MEIIKAEKEREREREKHFKIKEIVALYTEKKLINVTI